MVWEISDWLMGEIEEKDEEIANAIKGENLEKEKRYISKEKRYAILKRQKWKCNQCFTTLKYSIESNWKGEIAHIDHIHPYSKRQTYPNGVNNINELSNLQALCPKCNKEKSNKEVC